MPENLARFRRDCTCICKDTGYLLVTLRKHWHIAQMLLLRLLVVNYNMHWVLNQHQKQHWSHLAIFLGENGLRFWYSNVWVWFAGSPLPKPTWTKDGKPLKGAQTDQTPEMCKIKLKKVKREDEGEYELELVNPIGKEKVPVTIKVIGRSKVKVVE